MSGPTTTIYETAGDAVLGASGLSAVLLAARAIAEARDMHAEYGEAHERVRQREADRRAQRERLQQANRERTAALHRQAERLQARLARLQAVAAPAGAAPAAIAKPANQDERAWVAYLAALEAAIKEVEARLSAADMEAQAKAALMAEQPDVNQLLTAYAQQRALHSRLAPEEIAHYKALSLHLLSRLDIPQGASLPIRIEFLARDMLQAGDAARAEALATDLRLEIQRANERREQQRKDAEEAAAMLAQFGDELPPALQATLEQVAAGVLLLDKQARDIARSALEELKAARQREEQEATALVVEQSLRDLGYEVEGICETLFVSGGVAHFQKQSWQGYHVRMRVSANDKSINFNVVRAQGSGDAEQDKRLDYLAEDRWCAEFPALLKTLAARGVKLTVTRQLQAGELPVQVVDASTLPKARVEEERRGAAAPKQMHLDDRRK